MPTYTYRCKSCSYEFEEFQKITDERLIQCPSCKKDTLIRVIDGGAGLVFKGSGFYHTDYKRSGEGKAAKDSGEKENTSETKKESGSTTKTESKSETKMTE